MSSAAVDRIKAAALFLGTIVTLSSCDDPGYLGSPLSRPPPGVPRTDMRPRPWPYAAFTRGREDTFDFHVEVPVDADLTRLPHANDAVFTCAPGEWTSDLHCSLRWRAAPEDTGRYLVRFRARNDLLGGLDTTLIYTIAHDGDQRPVMTCPDTLNFVVGVRRQVTVSASDPDGDPIFDLQPDSRQVGAFRVLSWAFRFSGSRASGTGWIVADEPGYAYLRFTATNATNADGGILLQAAEP